MGNDNQQQFITWLAGKLKVKDENEFKTKLQSMGKDGIKQAYDDFVKEQSKQVPAARDGSKLDYLKCLKEFKKGGSVGDCGCKAKMEKGGAMEEQTPKFKKGESKKQQKEDKKTKTWLMLNKHQQGGALQALGGNPNQPLSPKNPLMVQKSDGSIGQWGNALPNTQKQYALSPTSKPGQQGQIGQSQLDSLRKLPNIAQLIGQPIPQSPGAMAMFAPEQSSIIRQLMKPRAPQPQEQQQLMIATKQEGGPIGDGAYKFSTSKLAKRFTPHTVVMGQGAGTITSR